MNAISAANYLLLHLDADAGDSITNLKLQKLLYYAQGLHLAMEGNTLFDEPIMKWAHGPVVPAVFHHFESFGPQPLEPDHNFAAETLSASEREFLEEVYHVYGQFAAWKLRDMVFHDDPWRDTADTHEIAHDALRKYFVAHLY